MEYRRTETGFEPLPRRNVDYGGGLERIAAASIDASDVFRISLLWPIIERLEALSACPTTTRPTPCGSSPTTCACDLPRCRRRAAEQQDAGLRHAPPHPSRGALRLQLGLEENLFPEIIPTIAALYDTDLPRGRRAHRRGHRGPVEGGARVPAHLHKGSPSLRTHLHEGATGADLFVLYDTFGFPVELSTEEAERQGIGLSAGWRAEFDEQMAAQRARSRAGVVRADRG